MADTKIHVRPATAQLKDDHRAIRKLFADYEDLREDEEIRAAELFDVLQRELEIHAEIEEEIFYPAVQGDGARLVREAFESHLLARRLLRELEALTPGVEEFNAKLNDLEDEILRHFEEEEVEIFPVFDGLPRDEREDVADRIMSRRRELSGEE